MRKKGGEKHSSTLSGNGVGVGLLPLQGEKVIGIHSQDVALNYAQVGLSGRVLDEHCKIRLVSDCRFTIGNRAVVNIFRNSVNNFRKLSTSPVQ